MSGHCKDCKWWGEIAEGICNNERFVLFMSSVFYGMDPKDPENCLHGIETAPDFSCGNFEQKVESTQTQ